MKNNDKFQIKRSLAITNCKIIVTNFYPYYNITTGVIENSYFEGLSPLQG